MEYEKNMDDKVDSELVGRLLQGILGLDYIKDEEELRREVKLRLDSMMKMDRNAVFMELQSRYSEYQRTEGKGLPRKYRLAAAILFFIPVVIIVIVLNKFSLGWSIKCALYLFLAWAGSAGFIQLWQAIKGRSLFGPLYWMK